MGEAWLTALLKTPPVIYGRRLRAFSLSHAAILSAMRNGYWTGRSVTHADLVEAVDVCSRTWEQNVQWFDRPRLRALRKLTSRSITRHRFEQAHGEFAAYLNDYMQAAPRDDGPGRNMHTPWYWRLAAFLIERGFSESEAWNMPVCRARCYFDAHAEMNGDESFLSESQARGRALSDKAHALDQEGKADEAAVVWEQAQAAFREGWK